MRLMSHTPVTRTNRGHGHFLSDEAGAFDPLLSEMLFSELLAVSGLLSEPDADADPLLPDEPFDDDFFA